MVPVLEDDGMVLTESSAILKYLAEKIGSAAYPKELKQRACVNERMDWFNTNLYRDYGYGLVYPQSLPFLAYSDPVANKACVERGLEKSKAWLAILDRNLLGPKRPYLCGEQITIADYLGACILEAGKLVNCSFATYPNVCRWLERMRALPNWGKVHEAFYGFAGSLKGKSFVAV
jgi:glutathione S-transferase